MRLHRRKYLEKNLNRPERVSNKPVDPPHYNSYFSRKKLGNDGGEKKKLPSDALPTNPLNESANEEENEKDDEKDNCEKQLDEKDEKEEDDNEEDGDCNFDDFFPEDEKKELPSDALTTNPLNESANEEENEKDDEEEVDDDEEEEVVLVVVEDETPMHEMELSNPVHEVNNFQNSAVSLIPRFYNGNSRQVRRFARLEFYISQVGLDYRNLNRSMNSEAYALGKPNIFPNLPQMAKTHLDHFLKPMKAYVFVVNSSNFSLSFNGPFCDVEESVLNLIVANLEAGYRPTIHARPCGSLSETVQTPVFTSGVENSKCQQIIALTIFSDGTSLGNTFHDALHPVDIAIDYGRHLKVAKFDRTRVCVGWLPKMQDCNATRSGVEILWKKIPQAHKAILTRLMQKKIEYFILAQLKTMVRKLYNFAYGIGVVRFQVFQFKADYPEKRDWSHLVGCVTCADETVLSLSSENFRSFQNPMGRVHKIGVDVNEWGKVSPTNDGYDVFSVPDLMVSILRLRPKLTSCQHTLDNTLSHLIRMIGLVMFSPLKSTIKVGAKSYTIEIVNGNCLRFKNGSNLSERIGAADDGDRVTRRFEVVKKTPRWLTFVQHCRNVGGDQTMNLLGVGGSSMMDRAFGLRGLVLALKTSSETPPNVMKLVLALYSVVTYLFDAGCGFCLELLKAEFENLLNMWLLVSKTAGIGAIPISVHSFFHFPALISKFGAPLLNAIYLEESSHGKKKKALLHNSNRVRGLTGADYLFQIMNRERRRNLPIFPKRIGSWGHLQDVGQHRVLAIAPNSPAYLQARKEVLIGANACFCDSCFACSAVEFQTSLLFNDTAKTRDEFIVPLGFIQESNNTFVLGVKLVVNTNTNQNDVLNEVNLMQPCTVEMFDTKRVRGECVFKSASEKFYVLRRLRLILS